MPRKRSATLTDHELRLMEVLWNNGSATVAEVTAGVGSPPLAYNTVLTTMRTLEQKGHVAHTEDGRAFVYRPLIARTQAADSAVRQLLQRFFGNSPGALAVTLLDEARLSEDDLARIQKTLSRKRKASR
ncbi:MAG TPA: BlaI/MecI/CopY family transcriptional regulator [Candidatus Baltobacteraceae bacterium]|nr:BlaI/MecI/CopY family transcriptional regulator [Candidatus Baltobacteraceae bacterium]